MCTFIGTSSNAYARVFKRVFHCAIVFPLNFPRNVQVRHCVSFLARAVWGARARLKIQLACTRSSPLLLARFSLRGIFALLCF